MLRRVTIPRAAAMGGVAVALALAVVHGARAAATRTADTRVRGLDISAYQHAGTSIDWATLVTQGIRFVSIKASEGTYYRNPYYSSDAQGAAAAGLLVMPYVFANPGRSGGTATADFAAKVTGATSGARLPLVVDLENDPYKRATDCYRLGVPAMIGWVASFTKRARELTGSWPTIYTTADWWRECTRSTRRFPHDPLWLAAFGDTAPTVPAPWEHWTFWQYDNAGTLAGIGHADLDYYQPTGGLPALSPLAGPVPGKEHGKKRGPAAKSKLSVKDRHKPKSHHKRHGKGKPKPRPKKHRGHHPSVSSRYPGKR